MRPFISSFYRAFYSRSSGKWCVRSDGAVGLQSSALWARKPEHFLRNCGSLYSQLHLRRMMSDYEAGLKAHNGSLPSMPARRIFQFKYEFIPIFPPFSNKIRSRYFSLSLFCVGHDKVAFSRNLNPDLLTTIKLATYRRWCGKGLEGLGCFLMRHCANEIPYSCQPFQYMNEDLFTMCTTRLNGPRLVIDTDVGTDDALALILCVAAERRGDAEILGVTCVHGNTDLPNVCVNTLKTLHTLQRLDLPVYRGASESIVQTFKRAPEIHGTDGFGDFEYPDTPDVASHLQQEHAVNFLTRITRENPGREVGPYQSS
uniref:Inosine/uridine-preferring nucleoside hydrolase domain-containing protein n=1 Tax=Timema genevievae TaxID=629358 RepID=A0A7R9JYZ9_TIMGE|nr:unnamed protein product [Timema genevievae]